MQIDITAVTEQFRSLADLTPDQAAGWLFLCQSAKAWVEARLLDTADPLRDGGRLALAAAAIAYHRWALASLPASELGHLRLGDFSVSPASKGGGDTRAARAAALRQELLAAVSDCLRPEGGPAIRPVEGGRP